MKALLVLALLFALVGSYGYFLRADKAEKELRRTEDVVMVQKLISGQELTFWEAENLRRAPSLGSMVKILNDLGYKTGSPEFNYWYDQIMTFDNVKIRFVLPEPVPTDLAPAPTPVPSSE